MRAVKVQYTVKPEFAEENKTNIQKVMSALNTNPIVGMQYSSYTDNDNPNTFIHINMAKDEETMSKLSDLQEFTAFRMALKASQPLSPPKQTTLNLVGAGFSM
ncbi:MAG: hypothetical protein COA58_10555 [Bacteroidetes bacterium]|nr:MAG: hypothetical protein COA58_10555 [Bacteroidota bacterium]